MRSALSVVAAMLALGSISETREGYGNVSTGGPGAGWERKRRSPEVSAMLIEKAQAKRERKAAIRAARATI